MPLPASYDDATLTAFLETELTPVLAPLGLDVSDAIIEAVNEVAGLLGHDVSEEDTVAGVMKVRALARWQGWLAAWSAATLQYDIKAGTSDITRSQAFEQIGKRLQMAESAAMRYEEAAAVIAGAGGTATVSGITTPGPYGYWPWPGSW